MSFQREGFASNHESDVRQSTHFIAWNHVLKQSAMYILRRIELENVSRRVGLIASDIGISKISVSINYMNSKLRQDLLAPDRFTSPAKSGSAPMNCWIASTCAFGPAISEVPVSAIA